MTLKYYWDLWQTVEIDEICKDLVQEAVDKIKTRMVPYHDISAKTGVPVPFIAAIHYRECSLNFESWLANGDPLFDKYGDPVKTVDVPAGLGPCRNFTDAAVMSLNHDGLNNVTDWSISNALYVLEKFNGMGYFRRNMNSPYLWSMTNHYLKGKFNRDGHYDPTLIDKQVGCVPIILGLKASGIDIDEMPPIIKP